MSVLGTATMFNQNEYVFVLINSQKITTSTINANSGFFSTIYAQNIGGTVNISNIRAGDISSITGYIASLTATQASINSLTSTDINTSTITAKYIELYEEPFPNPPLWNSATNYVPNNYVLYSNIRYVTPRFNLNVAPNVPIPDWLNNTPYLANNYAFVPGVGTYRCKSNTPGSAFPPNSDPQGWDGAFGGNNQSNVWQTSPEIYSGIVGDNNSYITVGNANVSTITAKYIELYKYPGASAPLWNSNVEYGITDYVSYSNIDYVSVRSNLNIVPNVPIPGWVNNTPYLANNYAFVAGVGTYRCKSNTPGSAFPPNGDPQGWAFAFLDDDQTNIWQTTSPIYSGIVGDSNSYINVGNANVSTITAVNLSSLTGYISSFTTDHISSLTGYISTLKIDEIELTSANIVSLTSSNINTSTITAKYIELYTLPSWNSNIDYGVNAIVSYSNQQYQALRVNLNINPSEPIPDWVDGKPYMVNNYAVGYTGYGAYRCISNTPGSAYPPFSDPVVWQFGFPSANPSNIWQTNSPVYSGIVGDQNSYINVGTISSLTGYISSFTADYISSTTASISFLASCNIITSSITSISINASTINSKNIELYAPSLWNSNIDYRTNDIVTYSNQQYQALRNNLNVNPSEPIPEWLADTPYKKNNYGYVISVASYQCLADTPGNSFPPNSDPVGWASVFINNNQSNIWQPIPNIRSGIVGDSNSYINIGTISSLTGYISSFTTDHISSQTASISSLRSSDISSLTGYISSFTTDHISSQTASISSLRSSDISSLTGYISSFTTDHISSTTASISSIFSQSLTVSSLQATFGFFSNLMATVANFSSISVSSIFNSNLHINDLTVNNLYSSNIYNGGDIFAQDITSVNFTNSNEFTNIGDTTLNKLTTNGVLTANSALTANGGLTINSDMTGTFNNVTLAVPPFTTSKQYLRDINNIRTGNFQTVNIVGGSTGNTVLPNFYHYSDLNIGATQTAPARVTLYGVNINPLSPLQNLTTALTVYGDTQLTGNTSFYPLNGSLTAFNAYGNAYVTGTFNVTGLMTALGAVVLTGTTNCLANLNVALLMTVTGITSLLGGALITGVFTVQNATINFNNQVGGSAYTFYNYGGTVLNNGLTLNGNGNANNNFGVGGNLNVNGNTTLGGNATVGAILTTSNLTLKPYVPPTFPGWSESVVYNSNDKVTRTDLFYNALLTNLNTDPDGYIPPWESNVTYATFEIAQYSNSTFRATTSSSNVAPLPSNADWSFLFGGGDITNIWQLYNPPPVPSFITGDAISFVSVGSVITSNLTTSNLTVGNGSAVVGTPLYLEQNTLQNFEPTLIFKNNITDKSASIVFNSSEELLTTQACNITFTSVQTASLLAGSNIYMYGISSIVLNSDDINIFGNSNVFVASEFGNVGLVSLGATVIGGGFIQIQSSCNIDIGASGNIFSQCDGELTLNSFSNTLITATGTIGIGAQGDAQFVSATGRVILASGGSNNVEINAVGTGSIIANTFGTGGILLYNGSNNGVGINETGVNLGSDSNIDLTASNSIILNAPVVNIPGSNTVIQSISTLRLSTGTFFADTASFQSISTLSLSTGTLFANSISSINIQASNIATSTLRATNTLTASTISIDRIVGLASATNVFTNNLFPISAGAQLGFGSALASGGYYNFLFGRSTFTTNINPATDGATTANNIKVAGHLSTVSLGVSTINFKAYGFISTLSNSIVTTTATIATGTPGLTRLQSNALRFPFPGTYNITQKYSISKGSGGGTHGCLIYDSNGATTTTVANGNNWSRMGMASVPFHDQASVSTFTTAVTTILANSANLTRDLYYYDSGSGNYTASFYIAPPTIQYVPSPGITPDI